MRNRTHILPKADAIIRKRILAGLNKQDVASRANIPPSSVSRAEMGRCVSPRTAAGISRVLGEPFDDLFTIWVPASGERGEV